jgi:cell shape-determining protein MreC
LYVSSDHTSLGIFFNTFLAAMSSLVGSIQALESENARLKKQIADLPASTTVLLELVTNLEQENKILKEQIARDKQKTPVATVVYNPYSYGSSSDCRCDDTNARCPVHD